MRGLGGERERWTEAAKQLQLSIDSILGNILVSVGIVSYLGPFTHAFRSECVGEWVDKVKVCTFETSKLFLKKTLNRKVISFNC